MKEELVIKVSRRAQSWNLRLIGEADFGTSGMLSTALSKAVNNPDFTSGSQLTVDMLGVNFVDSAGLSALIAAYKQISAKQARFILVIANERVMRPFRITGLTRIMDIRRSKLAA